jgi:YD repeat-containing protein
MLQGLQGKRLSHENPIDLLHLGRGRHIMKFYRLARFWNHEDQPRQPARRHNSPSAAARAFRPSFDVLEDRILLSLYVADLNTNQILPSNNTPLNSFSNWAMSLAAQVSGATVTGYSWNFSQAPDATSITGQSSYNAQFTWKSFLGAPRTDTISITETNSGSGPVTQSFTFTLAATDSPAWSSAPTSAATWLSVISPDQLNGQAVQGAGPYAVLGVADGSVRTTHSLPSYNPNVTPLALVYNSTVANRQPIFVVRYQLNPSQSLPSSVTAQLTLTNAANQLVYNGPTVYYNPTSLNPGDWVQMALQAITGTLPTGVYNWQITVSANSNNTNYSGQVDLLSGSTTPDTGTANPFGPGWSLTNVARLWPTNTGVILQNPDGTSLWFANGQGQGTYVTPAGDFSTLTYNSTTLTYTRTLPNGTQINFNGSGWQTSIIDRDGNTTSFSYNGAGELLSVTDMNNQVNNLGYNSAGYVTSITDPANRSLGLSFNSSNQLVSLIDPDTAVWGYAYDTNSDLTGLSDPRASGTPPSYTTNFTYTAARASGVTQPDGTTLALTPVQLQGMPPAGTGTQSSPAPAVLWATAPANFIDGRGNTWATYLDGLGFGHPVSQADPLGDTSLTFRDINGLAWLQADPLGRRTRFFFDSQGNPTQTVYADDTLAGQTGEKRTFNHFAETQYYTDPTGATYTYTYNSKGDLTQVQNPLNGLYTYSYNSAGIETGMTDPMGFVYTYTLDTLNRRTGQTDPMLYTQSWGYDSASDLTSYTNQNAVTVTYSFDQMGRLLQQTVPDNSTTSSVYTFTYDRAGNPSTEVIPISNNGTLITATTTYSYDAMNRLGSTTDALNEVIRYTFDGDSNVVAETNALGYTTSYTIDTANRQVTMTIPISGSGQNQVTATSSYSYDAAGEMLSSTDPLNNVYQYTYTARGFLASETDPLQTATVYNYDGVGDITSKTITPHTGSAIYYTYSFDKLHNLIGTTEENLHLNTTYTRDADSRVTAIAGYNDGQGNISYTYDKLGRQLTQSDALSDTWTYAYDGVGNQTQITTPVGFTGT